MRILHTSDWHLGRAFHREPMLGHQAAFIDHLMEVVTAEAVDVVVVSGDVYDKALPPVDAVRLADEAIARLAASPAALVLISGNHDSPHRLGFGAAVMERAGVHVRTRPAAVAEPVLVEDRHGPVEFYAIPYLDPAAWAPVWELGERSHPAVLAEAMRRIRTRRRTGTTPRWCVAAHASVTGGCATDSERDISVGGIDHVSASVFADAHYAALGHLHRPQQLRDTIRYSGSPWRTPSPRQARSRGAGWSTSPGTAASPQTSCPRRCPEPSPACEAIWPISSPTPSWPRSATAGSRWSSPTPNVPRAPWSACGVGSRTR